MSSVTGAIESDVLIIGGGVQGLWLLNELHDLGYVALLVERRELGGGQTCHSHVYIHEGHLYRSAHSGLSRKLHDLGSVWEDWLTTHPVDRGYGPSCFGFQSPSEADDKLALWSSLGLQIGQTTTRAVLNGGPIRRLYETGERCLIGPSLVDELRSGVEQFISGIDEIASISMTINTRVRDADRVVEVQALMQGQPMTFKPRAVVLAAGAGNQALLDLAAGGRRASAAAMSNAQQLRLGHMLVINGPASILQPLTGIFPDLGGLFIVSRVVRKDGQEDEVVWLVSDDRSPPLAFLEDWLDRDARAWLPEVLGAVEWLAPLQFDPTMKSRLRWGVYAAPKAEGRSGGGLPDEERIERLRVANLWAVWPTKLTLAPRASRTLAGQLQAVLGSPPTLQAATPEWIAARRRPDTAPERWTRTPLLSWDDFRRCYYL